MHPPASSQGPASGPSRDSTLDQTNINPDLKQDDEVDKASPRAPIACSACRARKVKCSGDKPVCATCAKSNQTCIYTPHVKRKRRVRGEAGRKESRPRIDLVPSDELRSVDTNAIIDPPQSNNGQSNPNQAGRTQPFVPIPAFGVAGPSTYAQPSTNSEPHAALWVPPLSMSSGEPFLSSTPRQYQYDYTDPSKVPPLDFLHDMLSWQGNNTSTLHEVSVSNGNAQSSDPQLLPLDLGELLGWSHAMNPTRQEIDSSSALPRTASVTDDSTGKSGSTLQAGIRGVGHQPSQSRLRVPYFRFFGPTAIAPGYKRVVYDVSRPPSPKAAASKAMTDADQGPTGAFVLDEEEEYPHIEALRHLIPLFIQHFSYFFPFLRFSPSDFEPAQRDKPPYLLNIACALAARYSATYGRRSLETDNPSGVPSIPTAAASHVWASKAKEQVSGNLGYSSAHMVETLLLISWYEFGQDRDGGLWMYSGMGLRMGQDLGLDSLVKQSQDGVLPGASTMDGDEMEAWRLHCSLMMMDAIMTIGTGRPGMYITPNATIPDFPHLITASGVSVPDPFGYLAKILVLVDRTTRILVQDTKEDIEPLLEKAQSALNEFHTSLPSELRFETSTFQQYASIGQGSSFVLLHFWFHTLIILSYRPSLLRSDSIASDLSESDTAGNEIAISSAKTILDIASFAELIDAKAVHQPWINYPLYTAGRTFLSQSLQAKSAIEDPSDYRSAGRVHLAKTARANFQRVVSIFTTLEKYWSGVRYIHSALVQKAEGVHSVTLMKGEGSSVEDVPSPLAALWSGSPPANRSGVVGLSFTGTMNSPTDNFFSLLYPSSAVAAQPGG
ncbi:hypothetical protein IAU59_006276 [Kwoniella sp. CBS 9459]